MEELYSAEGIPVSSTGTQGKEKKENVEKRNENYLLKLDGWYDLEHLLQGHTKWIVHGL